MFVFLAVLCILITIGGISMLFSEVMLFFVFPVLVFVVSWVRRKPLPFLGFVSLCFMALWCVVEFGFASSFLMSLVSVIFLFLWVWVGCLWALSCIASFIVRKWLDRRCC